MRPSKSIDYESEYTKMKKNNRNLAKALAEQQQLNKKLQDENNILQKKLYISSTLNMQYDKRLTDLFKLIKQNITCCIDLSNSLSESLVLCKESSNLKKTFDNDNLSDLYKVDSRSYSPGNSHKTQAVKPMVSGHVIHYPTINLSRLAEPRFAGIISLENTVQNHDSPTNMSGNNHVSMSNSEVNNSLSNNHMPIQGYLSETLEDETDDSLEEDSLTENDTQESTPFKRSRSLEPLLEQSDEEVRSSSSCNNSITKEVRILLEPLNLENNFLNSRDQKVVEKSTKRALHYDDPLEGTSSMLDDTGNIVQFNNYVSKPRQASKRMCLECESDSEESTIANEGKVRSKWITKRRAPTEKKDVTGQKYKVKRNKTDENKENNSSNDSSDGSNETLNSNNSMEDVTTSGDRRARRSAQKSLAEPSLKTKLRR